MAPETSELTPLLPPRRHTPLDVPTIPGAPRLPRHEAPTMPPPTLDELLAKHPPESRFRTPLGRRILRRLLGDHG